MPTRQGWTIAGGAMAALVTGRIFAILELFVIGAALAVVLVVAIVVVRAHRPDLSISRWAHPPILTVGDIGRVDLLIANRRSLRSPRVTLTEPVGPDNTAHMTIAPLPPGEHVRAGYRVPATQRGLLQIGPTLLDRRDLLGLATDQRPIAGGIDIAVSPRTFDLAMPSLGSGILGRHLLALSQRVGTGEFHSLRDYVDGDEPRSIHWKASARSDNLKVRQHEAQGVRRCIVVLDRDSLSFPTDPASSSDDCDDAFERAVSIAGSLVLSADRTGLTTRFVSGGGIDLRGPDVASHTLRTLAAVDVGPTIDEYERDPGEGLGLLIIVTASASAELWRSAGRIIDPMLTRVGVFTSGAAASQLVVDASTLADFRDGWQRLAGTRGLTRNLAPAATS